MKKATVAAKRRICGEGRGICWRKDKRGKYDREAKFQVFDVFSGISQKYPVMEWKSECLICMNIVPLKIRSSKVDYILHNQLHKEDN